MDIDITLHPAQWQAFQSTKRITAFVAGIQSGKTKCGSLWMAKQVAEHDDEDVNFILASPNYKIMNQSATPALAQVMRGCGEYHKMDDVWELNGGGKLWCRSMTDPNSCEGLSNVRAIWIDEAGMLDYLSWANLQGRAAFMEAPIFISTTPYRLNWLYELWCQWMKGQRDDCEFVVCRSIDNPYFPADEVERQRRILTPQLFAMKYEGTFSRPGGLVYADYSPESHRVEHHAINRAEYMIYCGVDVGYNDPSAIMVVAVHRTGRDMIVIDEAYRSGWTVMDRLAEMQRLKAMYGIAHFVVDSAEAAEIETFRRAGLPVMAVVKGKGSVFDGVTKVQQLLRTYQLKIMDNKCPNLRDEMSQYSYRENKDGGLSDDIEDAHNHALDALRYVIMTVWTAFFQSVPAFKPAQTHLQKLIKGEYRKVEKNADDW